MMCDANGAGEVDATSFGGNHQGAGGNVLFVDASVQWLNADAWTNDTIRTTNDFTCIVFQ
jgi:prepilin-type processing-associated H-X9-DG protein